jgi:ATP-dependent protease ClpP protease subunit
MTMWRKEGCKIKIRDLGEEAEMVLDEPIYSDWGEQFAIDELRKDLAALKGKPATLWINSPGGDVFTAAKLYTAIKEYPGKVTVKIPAIAASAATVIAMAGDEVFMALPAMMMVHLPWSLALGNAEDMRSEAKTLDEIGRSIVEVYKGKTGKGDEELLELMRQETWMSSRKAVELGFADGVIEEEEALLKGDLGLAAQLRRLQVVDRFAACLYHPGRMENPVMEDVRREKERALAWLDLQGIMCR